MPRNRTKSFLWCVCSFVSDEASERVPVTPLRQTRDSHLLRTVKGLHPPQTIPAVSILQNNLTAVTKCPLRFRSLDRRTRCGTVARPHDFTQWYERERRLTSTTLH